MTPFGETLYTVCRVCGATWETKAVQSPRQCIIEGCDAGWLDIAQFADIADAGRAAREFARERGDVLSAGERGYVEETIRNLDVRRS